MSFFPRLELWRLPQDEWRHAKFVEANLAELNNFIDQLAATVNLGYFSANQFDANKNNASAQKAVREWVMIAARNGSIILYSYLMITEKMDVLIHEAPILGSLIDKEAKRRATNLFSERFPGIQGVRNSAAHPGEFSATPTQIAKHQTTDPVQTAAFSLAEGMTVFLGGGFSVTPRGIEFTATFKKRLVKYVLSPQAVDDLREIFQAYVRVFHPVLSDAPPWLSQVSAQWRWGDESVRRV